MIKIVGLGPGAPEALTIGTLNILEKSSNVYFRTEKHPTMDYIKDKIKDYKTCDKYYELYNNFDEVYMNIAKDVLDQYKEIGELVYAVPGHPLVAEKSVINLMKLCDLENIEYEVVPAVSFIDAMMEALKIDPIEGIKVIDAFDINNQILDKRVGTIITQVYNAFIASEVKLKLLENYYDETEVFFVRAAGVKGLESIRKMPLYEIDMQEDIDYLTSIYIPKDLENKKDIYDLVEVVEVLRGENGCSWDREQNHQSIKMQLVEEAYEVVDAINNDDIEGIIEELGDVLLHVVFHSSIGREEGYFELSDVVNSIYNKMIYRHPHVFANKELKSSDEVMQKWEDLKQKEKKYQTFTDELKGIAKSLPALIRADKVQKKASRLGFDWDNVVDASKKVTEELDEVLEVYNSQDKDRILDEVGDLLFACVNVARFLGVDEEEALNSTTNKFIYRLSIMEKELENKNSSIKEASFEELNELWEKTKKN